MPSTKRIEIPNSKGNGKCEVCIPDFPNDEKAPNSYQFVNCHNAFGIKMKDLTRKSCLVVGGHVTQMLEFITYSSGVTIETVCIALPMAVIYDLEVKTADV